MSQAFIIYKLGSNYKISANMPTFSTLRYKAFYEI